MHRSIITQAHIRWLPFSSFFLFRLVQSVESPFTPDTCLSSLQTGFIYTEKKDTHNRSVFVNVNANANVLVCKPSSIISKHCNHSVHSIRSLLKSKPKKPKPMCLVHVHIIRIQLPHFIIIITVIIYSYSILYNLYIYIYICSVCTIHLHDSRFGCSSSFRYT